MDKIIFVDNGTVAAVGTHAELCRSCPDYNTMVELQRLDDMEAAQSENKEGKTNA